MRWLRPSILDRMSEIWPQEHLPEIVATLARRPGHEHVRTLLAEVLRYRFGIGSEELGRKQSTSAIVV